MCLPYWDSEIDVEIGDWGFSLREYGALSAAGLHSELLKRLSEYALSLDSELLYLCGGNCGIAGSMIWEESVLNQRGVSELSPFTLVLGYSREMERFAARFADSQPALKAGVTRCTFWSRRIPLSSYKVIAFMAALPTVNETEALEAMLSAMATRRDGSSLVPYYAERLGFLRAPVAYETDTPQSLLVMSKLDDFQMEATRSVVGPPPSAPLPLLYAPGIIGSAENSQ